MNKSKLKNFKLICPKTLFLILFIMILILKSSILNTPHHWDSIARDLPISIWIKNNNFNPFPQTNNYNGHPVFFYEILALSFFIFGESLFVSHLVTLIFAFLAVYFTYLLGKYLYKEKVGIIAALLLFFSPLFFAQSGIVQIEIAFAALSIITIYFTITNEVKWYLIIGSFLVLTKEPAVLIIFCILIYRYIKNPNFLKKLLIYSIPLFIFGLWMMINKLVFDWFLYTSSVSYLDVSINILPRLLERFKEVFILDYKWILTFLVSISALKFYINKRRDLKIVARDEYILFLLIILAISLYCCFIGKAFLIRYILVLYPIFFVVGANSLNSLFEKNVKIILMTLFLIGLFITRWGGNRINRCGCELESNLEYLDLVKTHYKAAKYIETNFPNATVLTTWPQTRELTFPYLGYVITPIKIKTAYEYDLNLSDIDLIYYSPQSHEPEILLDIMTNLNLTLLKRFEQNGKYSEIYKPS